MNKRTVFSAIPMKEIFRDLRNDLFYQKSSCNRAKLYGTQILKLFKKHQPVEWVNAWPNQIENEK